MMQMLVILEVSPTQSVKVMVPSLHRNSSSVATLDVSVPHLSWIEMEASRSMSFLYKLQTGVDWALLHWSKSLWQMWMIINPSFIHRCIQVRILANLIIIISIISLRVWYCIFNSLSIIVFLILLFIIEFFTF